MRRWDGGNYFFKNMKRRTGKRRKEQHRQWAMNQGWERREHRANLLRSRRFVVLFFFCWHSEHGGSRQRFFYRSHATSQWSMDAGPLQTYTVEHALCGSAKRGHLGERGSVPPLTPSLTIYPLDCSLAHHGTLCTYFFFSTSPSFHPFHSDWKPLKDGVKQQRSDGSECLQCPTQACVL